MGCASEEVGRRVACSMGHILAAVPGRGSSQVSHTVRRVVVMVAVQPVLLAAEVGKVWPVLAPLLSGAARLAAPRSLLAEVARPAAPRSLFVLFLDYS
jgi:hypothetical protein